MTGAFHTGCAALVASPGACRTGTSNRWDWNPWTICGGSGPEGGGMTARLGVPSAARQHTTSATHVERRRLLSTILQCPAGKWHPYLLSEPSSSEVKRYIEAPDRGCP